MATVSLTGFADEIDAARQIQLQVLRGADLAHLELRAIDGDNVVDLTSSQIDTFRRELAAASITVSAIGSPIGKVQIRSDLEAHFERFRCAVERAVQFGTRFVRVFSFYHKGETAADCRDAVVGQFERMVVYAEACDCVLLHENESGIYGDVPERCLDLMQTIGSENLRVTFDPANFIQCGVDPLGRAWPLLAPFTVYFHIKDALVSTGRVVPAGQGDAGLAQILKEAIAGGFTGFLSLEPHLKADDPQYGGTGPERFCIAVSALRELLADLGIESH